MYLDLGQDNDHHKSRCDDAREALRTSMPAEVLGRARTVLIGDAAGSQIYQRYQDDKIKASILESLQKRTIRSDTDNVFPALCVVSLQDGHVQPVVFIVASQESERDRKKAFDQIRSGGFTSKYPGFGIGHMSTEEYGSVFGETVVPSGPKLSDEASTGSGKSDL